MVTFDATLPGTSSEVWGRDGRLATVPRLDLDPVTELLVFSAHPDDEVLGCGGLIAECRSRGIRTRVVIVTDGGASHDREGLVEQRAAEARAALPGIDVSFLGYPDGGTLENRDRIAADVAAILALLPEHALVAVPWRGDGHRDHRVVGEIVAAAVGRQTLLEYPVWLWHWGSPADLDVDSLVGLDIDVSAKWRAIAAHASQVGSVLNEHFLDNFRRPVEVYFETRALTGQYFDELYAKRDDPWRLATRWYEERKRAVTMSALPERRFASALEIGSSIGMLTELLGQRCDHVLALDISASAVESTRARTGDNVEARRADAATDYPEGTFDLIVLSEVGYYFSAGDLDRVLDRALASLADGGTIVACHWRHPVADYPRTGDEVHAAIAARVPLERIVQHIERDFVLDVYSRDGRSVAAREGLA